MNVVSQVIRHGYPYTLPSVKFNQNVFNLRLMLILYFKLDRYSLKQENSLCSWYPGEKSIDTFEDCQNAVGFVQTILPNTADSVTEEEESDYPKGCYVYDDQDGNMNIYFNTAATGSSDANSREVCILGM